MRHFHELIVNASLKHNNLKREKKKANKSQVSWRMSKAGRDSSEGSK